MCEGKQNLLGILTRALASQRKKRCRRGEHRRSEINTYQRVLWFSPFGARLFGLGPDGGESHSFR